MEREKLAENILVFFPLMFKKIMKDLPAAEISRQNFGLLHLISQNDCNTMSYYSKKIMLSKPNLTVMADKLIEEKLIERVYDPHDRRVIILKMTDKGRIILEEHKKKVKEIVIKKFELLNDEEVKRLNEIVNEMKTILTVITN
ncbi:MAG: MarR family transcriptional regulator [Bacillota bacterium]|nr:MarR family transcriptional regulator [Bacillota bacterium]